VGVLGPSARPWRPGCAGRGWSGAVVWPCGAKRPARRGVWAVSMGFRHRWPLGVGLPAQPPPAASPSAACAPLRRPPCHAGACGALPARGAVHVFSLTLLLLIPSGPAARPVFWCRACGLPVGLGLRPARAGRCLFAALFAPRARWRFPAAASSAVPGAFSSGA